MHGVVYQIDEEPITQENYVAVEDIPEYYLDEYRIDYFAPSTKRMADIEKLQFDLRGTLTVVDDKVSVSDKSPWFEVKYRHFMSMVSKLSKITLDEFKSNMSVQVLDDVPLGYFLPLLRDAYETEDDIYVWWYEELITLDEWLRRCECGKTYYIGGTLDFHY